MKKPRNRLAQTISLRMITNSVSDQDEKVEWEFLSYQHLRIKYSYNLILHRAKQQRHVIGTRQEVEH